MVFSLIVISPRPAVMATICGWCDGPCKCPPPITNMQAYMPVSVPVGMECDSNTASTSASAQSSTTVTPQQSPKRSPAKKKKTSRNPAIADDEDVLERSLALAFEDHRVYHRGHSMYY